MEAGAGLTQQVQTMVQELGAGCGVQMFELLHRNFWLHVHDAQDERRVLDLRQDGQSYYGYGYFNEQGF